MGLFRKRTEAGILPEEVNQYYISQRRERNGVMFVMAVLALVATLLIGLLLFFAGKFVYNAFTNDDNKAPATVQTDKNGTVSNIDELQIAGSGASSTSSTKTGSDNSGATSSSSSNSTTDSSLTVTQTPVLGDTDTTILPATGDPGH